MSEITKHEAIELFNGMIGSASKPAGERKITDCPILPAKVAPTYHKTNDGVEWVKTDGRAAATYLRKLADALEIE